MRLPPNNNTQVIETKYRLIINGIFFHRDDIKYCTNPFNTYGVDKNETINIFFICGTRNGVNGAANLTGQRYIISRGLWQRYRLFVNDPSVGDGMWANSQHINHEIGHNLSLLHTMMDNGGNCNDTWDDYCDDTPTSAEINSTYGYDPCCRFSTYHDSCSNNLMDYGNGNSALTPLQLGRVHWTLEFELLLCLSCHFTETTLDLCSVGYPQCLHMARSINAPGTGCSDLIITSNMYTTLVAENEFTLNPGFEVELGAQFEIIMNEDCP